MNILEYMKDRVLLFDGGTGTLLQRMGLAPGQAPETWNITHPEIIRDIHRAYYEAGSDVVCTNTFGANVLHYTPDELEGIVRAAIENARAAGQGFVALDIGPTGKLLAPYGDLDFEDAVEVFAKTVRLGKKYGADLIYIETINDLYEAKAALLAAKENCDLPVFISCAYSGDGKLMTGACPEAVIATLEGMGADAVGINCSLGAKALAPVAGEYLKYSSVPVIFKPNAGLPHVENGQTVYDTDPLTFARDVASLVREGVRIAGGCCGTTPEYISALKSEISGIKPIPVTKKSRTVVASYTHAVCFGDTPILIGERINPTGKKAVKEALRSGGLDYILSEAISQQEDGAHILDVNAGLPEIDEKEMLTRLVGQVQSVCDLPLQIDTSDPQAMEAALRRYNGKAMINSVNGKSESMSAVFPLVKKYGGLVVALTLDEGGIPSSAEGRLEIAKKILCEAQGYGIEKEDIIFDPLALTVSADGNAAIETLRAVSLIKRELGCKCSLGVSNVSYGLPERDALTSAFFTLALQNGLDAAIMNPHSPYMMRAYHAFLTLSGKDENCAGYISYCTKSEQGTEKAADLRSAIKNGIRESAATLTAEALLTKDPMSIVNDEIIPALDEVGMGYENKTVFLPQLLMSAEAAKAAFEKIKETVPAKSTGGKPPFVLATVKGDIHDIGKNIVRLLLENYGFPVCDLGKDVPPEKIVEKTVELHAPIVGLSALMTTTVPAMEETIKLLRKEAPWCKVVVGGAVLTEQYAEKIGADKYARDAMETVRYAESLK